MTYVFLHKSPVLIVSSVPMLSQTNSERNIFTCMNIIKISLGIPIYQHEGPILQMKTIISLLSNVVSEGFRTHQFYVHKYNKESPGVVKHVKEWIM